MTHELTNPVEPAVGCEVEATADALPQTIDSLFGNLDFVETPELIEARQAVIAGLKDSETSQEAMQSAWIEYAVVTEDIGSKAEDPRKANIAIGLHKALILRDAGLLPRYILLLDRAEVSAYYADLDDVSDAIKAEIDAIIESLEMSPEVLLINLRGIVSEEDRDDLYDMVEDGADLEKMLVSARTMIFEVGKNPNEVFVDLGLST